MEPQERVNPYEPFIRPKDKLHTQLATAAELRDGKELEKQF
jgi:hypothetical protein